MNRNRITILTVILTVTVVSLRSVPAAEKPSADAPPDDRAAIQKSVESYVAAFNAKDAKALAAHWSPEGVYIDRTSGQRTTGRDALEKEFQATLQTQKDARLNVKVASLEFVSPNVAIEQGAATITTPDGEPIVSSYSAVHVKRDGQWLIHRVSEQEIVYDRRQIMARHGNGDLEPDPGRGSRSGSLRGRPDATVAAGANGRSRRRFAMTVPTN